MKIYESKPWQVMEVVIDFLILNFLWLTLCLPVVTIGPATAALFGVTRAWVRDGDSGGFLAFFGYLKENFVQGLAVGLVWAAIGAALLLNLALGARMDSALRWPSLFLTALVGVAYLLTTPFLFPVMVHYRTTWTGVIRNAFVIAASRPLPALLALAVLGVFVFLTSLIPLSIFLTGSLTAMLIYRICDRAFQRIGGAPERRDAEGGGANGE